MEYLEVPNNLYKQLKTDQFDPMPPDHFKRHKRKHGHGHTASAMPSISQAPQTGMLTSVPDNVPTSVSGSETPIGDMSSPDIDITPDVTQMATDQMPSDSGDEDSNYENHMTALQRFGKFAKKEVGTVAGAAALAPLIPLKPMMRKILDKKGIKHSKTLKDIANKFYNDVIKKTPTAKANTFDYLECDLDDYTENNIIDAAIDIVTAIINFIKDIKNKAKKGTLLTDTEQDILDGSDSAVNKIKGKGSHPRDKKPVNNMILPVGIGAVVLIVILVLIFRKK